MGAQQIIRSMRFPRSKGNFAIEPKALDVEWAFDGPPEDIEAVNANIQSGLALLTIRGPMTHHAEWWFESYDEIIQRAEAAFYSDLSDRVLIDGDTPGGDVSGLFAAASRLLELQEETGKLLTWYVNGQTCSAGVGLAVAAKGGIYLAKEAVFGSIGVIAEVNNYREAAEKFGQKTYLITSGDFKADGHPMAKYNDEMEARIREGVMYEANIFWEWVAERRGVSVESVRALQAGIVRGQQAIDAGLCDEIMPTFSGCLQMVAGADLQDAPSEDDATGDHNMAGLDARGRPVATAANRAEGDADDMDSVRKKLGKMAADPDAKKARKARKLLEAMDAEDEKNDDDGDEKKDEPDGDEGESEDGDDEASSAEDDDEALAASAAEDDEGDDAKKAEDEEASAKKCEDDARKAEDESDDEGRKALKAEASKAKAHMASSLKLRNRAKSLRRAATEHRNRAKLYRSNAAVHTRLAAIEKRTGKRIPTGLPANPAAAAIGARGAIGESRGNVAKAASIADVPEDIRRKAGIGSASTRTSEIKDGGLHLHVVSTETAKARSAEIRAERAKLESGAK
jgi:ClpP class serine protease